MVTMQHFDLPRKLQQLGGFTNSIIVKYFEEYANLLYQRFGDRVKYWITINQPAEFCVQSYGSSNHAPGINAHGIGEYLCAHNALKSHAVAYRLYKSKYYNLFKGHVGISLNSPFFYSDTNDMVTVDRALQFSLGWVAHPIFSSKGGYPSVMFDQIAKNSEKEGRLRSRLPEFSADWIEKIRGSADFLGLNYYTSRYVEISIEPIGDNPSIVRDKSYKEVIKPVWVKSASEWLYSFPQGLGDILKWIKNEYNNPDVIITENGWSDKGELEDDGRIAYFHDHLQQVSNAISNDGCNVKAYTAWSLIDNFEWSSGYTEKFGLYFVNMSSPRRERIPKKSTRFIKELITTCVIPEIH
ncbi:myrosinase 1-like [Sitodiplosis mosellana]|uniref:myrosinase 1-like n=1 Tax=Sitodiplosis mosellana TaxID=263140 RepID=UPI002443E9B5|nr:myrosinase 1-like [Sitodiplosis mosellana]